MKSLQLLPLKELNGRGGGGGGGGRGRGNTRETLETKGSAKRAVLLQFTYTFDQSFRLGELRLDDSYMTCRVEGLGR